MPKRQTKGRKRSSHTQRHASKRRVYHYTDPWYEGEKSNQIGEKSERLVFETVQSIVDDGLLGFEVLNVVRTPPKFPDIDMYICTPLGQIPLQVKTSTVARKNFRAKHPNIPCVAVKAGDLRQNLIKELTAGYQHIVQNERIP